MIATAASGPFFTRVAPRRATASLDAAEAGERFCYFHAPAAAQDAVPRGAILAVHAFAEEMNKSRAVVADGARALAAAGFAVLQIDLTGCGDSAGDFEDATWDAWLDDLACGWAWLAAHAAGPRWLWGTRAGALLADQFSTACMPAVDGLLLWQPVVSGTQHLGQFLRLKTVGNLLRDSAARTNQAPAHASHTTPVERVAQPSPRADLASGMAIEVAGYCLTPALADAVEGARLGTLETAGGRVPPIIRWFDVSSQPVSITPIAARVVDRWRGAGSDVAYAAVPGPAFWQTQEVERCDALVEATVAALTGMDEPPDRLGNERTIEPMQRGQGAP